jgi:hypothetical protein
MEGTRTRNTIVDIHQELGPYGYKLTMGDIIRCNPLNNQARGESKIPIVVSYKNKETKSSVTRAAKAAGLWGGRVAKGEDKPEARRGYFRAPANGRRKHTPRSNRRKQETQSKRNQKKTRSEPDQTRLT